ncbi:hypothetical protein ACN47E_000603 [Coniothyrium glycines]
MAASPANQGVSRLYDEQPAFIYGTAWKKDQTKKLVRQALEAGFRRIDTAAQPRHYQEHFVGDALREAYSDGLLSRGELYIQTKYTTPAGQDLTNMPYDPSAPLDVQIQTSVKSSLNNLRSSDRAGDATYLDCLLLHSPLPTIEETILAWKLLEAYVPDSIKSLGISNVTLPILKAIYEEATIKPTVVQNRFYPQTRYDVPLRAFCREHGIMYQSFWTLTGNPALLRSKPIIALAHATGVEPSVALYSLVMDLGVVVLNGTTSTAHMRHDLEGIAQIQNWSNARTQEWQTIQKMFRGLVVIAAP